MIDLELVRAQYEADEERTRQLNIITAREYYDGDQRAKLTKRQEEFLGFNLKDERFAVNFCATVVDATTERMIVAGFESADEALSEFAWDVWKQNRMDAKQQEAHHATINDGEYFIMVDWPEGAPFPRLLPHPRYTDPELGGTGFGCKAHYVDDDQHQPLEAVSKRWVETYTDERGKRRTRSRMTLYYPDRIERYVSGTGGPYKDAGWQPFIETEVQTDAEGNETEIALPWPIPWTDAGGQPLGIPFAHFRKPGRLELWDAIPLQDLINKTALDIIATADACGFPIRLTYGWLATMDGKAPDSDGDNYLSIFPGAWIGTSNTDARTEVLPPADLMPLVETLNNHITTLAQVTDTPTSRFQLTRQVAAEGTLKQQEGPLLAKVRAYATQIGNAWEDVFYVCRSLGRLRGVTLAEDATLETTWEPFETRDEKQEMEKLEIKSRMGVPREQLWREMGYDADQIAEMQAMAADELQQQSNVGGELLRSFERGVV
jgi:hypothetical protein